jgi:hypothetical protein
MVSIYCNVEMGEREKEVCTSLWHPLNGEIFGFCHWVECDIFKVILLFMESGTLERASSAAAPSWLFCCS